MGHRYTKTIGKQDIIVGGISVLTKVSDTTDEISFFKVQVVYRVVLQKLVPCVGRDSALESHPPDSTPSLIHHLIVIYQDLSYIVSAKIGHN